MAERLEQVKTFLPTRAKPAVELATEEGASNWLTVIPIKDLNFSLYKREFWDAINLRHDWEITDTPKVSVCGDQFNVDHAMVCRQGGFIIQRHNEFRDLEAEMLSMVFNDVEIKPVLQEITGESLLVASGRDRDLHSSMSGFVTLMQILTDLSP